MGFSLVQGITSEYETWSSCGTRIRTWDSTAFGRPWGEFIAPCRVAQVKHLKPESRTVVVSTAKIQGTSRQSAGLWWSATRICRNFRQQAVAVAAETLSEEGRSGAPGTVLPRTATANARCSNSRSTSTSSTLKLVTAGSRSQDRDLKAVLCARQQVPKLSSLTWSVLSTV